MPSLGSIDDAVRGVRRATAGAAEEVPEQLDNMATPTAPTSRDIIEGQAPLSLDDLQAYRQGRQQQRGFKQPKYERSTPSDILFEVAANGMLSSTSTQITNALSTAAQAIMAPIDTAAKALVTMFNKPQDKVYLSEVVGDIYGLTLGTYKAMQYMGRRSLQAFPGMMETAEASAARYGISPGLNASKKLDYVNRRISSRGMALDESSVLGKLTDAIGSVVNLPSSLLNASDLSFKIIHDTRHKTRWAAHEVAVGNYRTHDEAMQAAIDNIDVSRRAVKEAEYYTFTGKPNMPIFSWVTDAAMEKLPGLRWVIPFKRTIANIGEQMIERSPLALASPTMLRRLTSSDAAERATAQSRLLAGSAILTSAAYMFGENLNGAAPKDRINREAWEKLYGPEHSLKFKDGTFSLDNLGIVGMQLKAVGMYRQMLETLPDKEFDPDMNEALMEKIGMYVAPIAEALYSSHFSKNLAEFFEVFERAREMDSVAPIEQWAERMAVRAIPVVGSTAWEQAMQSQDPIQRDAAQIGGALHKLLPEYRKTIRPVYDAYGAPMIVNAFRGPNSRHELNPYSPDDKLTKKFFELGMEFKQLPDELRAASPAKGIPGKMVKMTDQEYAEMHEWKNKGRFMDAGNGKKVQVLQSFRDYMSTWSNQEWFDKLPKENQQGILTERRERYNELLNEHVKTIPGLNTRLVNTVIQHKQQYIANLKNSEAFQK